MMRFLLLTLVLMALPVRAADGDDGPPIVITSPDAGTTFAYGDVKTHALAWDKNRKMLVAHVTFTDSRYNSGDSQTDYHEFRLPGVNFDAATGVFSATTAKGQVIPVARIKKVLFVKTIEVLPNANVRIQHPRGIITVTLEAIPPNDPAMHPSPTDPDGTHKVDINKVLN